MYFGGPSLAHFKVVRWFSSVQLGKMNYNITKRLSDTQGNIGYQRKPQTCWDFSSGLPRNRIKFPAWMGFWVGVRSLKIFQRNTAPPGLEQDTCSDPPHHLQRSQLSTGRLWQNTHLDQWLFLGKKERYT